jgi:hypothetical protein
MGPNKKYAQAIYGEEPKTMDELAQAVIKVLNNYQEHRTRREGSKTVMTSSPTARCVGLSWRVTHSDMVSNSHSGPEGYPQNFMRKKDIPTGYPGWTGRVWVRYEREAGYSFGSDPFNRTLTHTGTGGGGSYNGPWEKISNTRFQRFKHARGPNMYPEVCCFSWDFRIYDADWPEVTANIVEEREKAIMWATLNNKTGPAQPTHTFLWEDESTKLADLEFIEECRIINTSTMVVA